MKPTAWHVRPPKSVPSHSSFPLMAPLPHAEHLLASMWHCAHESVPVANPSDAHVFPPSAVPSHSSPWDTRPSPQRVGSVTASAALFCGVGVNTPVQSFLLTPVTSVRCNDRSSGVIGVGGPNEPLTPVNAP